MAKKKVKARASSSKARSPKMTRLTMPKGRNMMMGQKQMNDMMGGR